MLKSMHKHIRELGRVRRAQNTQKKEKNTAIPPESHLKN